MRRWSAIALWVAVLCSVLPRSSPRAPRRVQQSLLHVRAARLHTSGVPPAAPSSLPLSKLWSGVDVSLLSVDRPDPSVVLLPTASQYEEGDDYGGVRLWLTNSRQPAGAATNSLIPSARSSRAASAFGGAAGHGSRLRPREDGLWAAAGAPRLRGTPPGRRAIERGYNEGGRYWYSGDGSNAAAIGSRRWLAQVDDHVAAEGLRRWNGAAQVKGRSDDGGEGKDEGETVYPASRPLTNLDDRETLEAQERSLASDIAEIVGGGPEGLPLGLNSDGGSADDVDDPRGAVDEGRLDFAAPAAAAEGVPEEVAIEVPVGAQMESEQMAVADHEAASTYPWLWVNLLAGRAVLSAPAAAASMYADVGSDFAPFYAFF
eukprot:GHVU01162660.1.p1 GENE.GHVU01162660.1~~GHVU01162660.1.p1  ORF type:complete len:373 (+),score=48.73 GHVU01162660.1:151-1269(+)